MSGVYLLRSAKLLKVGDKSDVYADATMAAVKLKEPSQFYRSLAFLYKSGHPISNSFHLLASGLETDKEKVACLKVYAFIRQGKNLAQSLQKAGFSPTLVASVKAGEYSGKLDESLMWYAEFEQRNENLKRQLKQTLVNPLITVAFCLAMAVVLPGLVLRDQLTMLLETGADIPLLSKMLLGFSQMVSGPLIALPLAAVGTAWHSFKTILSLRSGRRKVELLLQKIPLIGEGLRRTACCRALAMMSLLLKSGLPIVSSIDLTSEGCGSLVLEERLKLTSQALRGGFLFSESLAKADWFTKTTIGLVGAGEVSGEVPKLLEIASEIEEDKLREALQTFAQFLQPLMLLIVGMLVCLTILAVLGPTLSLVQGI